MEAAEVKSELMTVAEAASYLRMSTHWVYKRVAQNLLPHLRVGRAVRFTRAGLDSWLASNRS